MDGDGVGGGVMMEVADESRKEGIVADGGS